MFWDPKIDYYIHVADNWPVLLNVHKHHSHRPILVLHNYADSCLAFKDMSDEEVINNAMEVIRKVFPKAPQLKQYLRSNWSNDKYSQHSYTCLPVGSSPKDFEVIARSIGQEKVLFAGEHTYFDFVGCTHNAMISGVRAAEKIVGMYVRMMTEFMFLILIISRVY